MVDFLINSLLWIFALYGLFEIVKNIVYSHTNVDFHSDGINIIIAVKNQEKNIEFFLRSLIFRIIYGKEEQIQKLFILDLNSSDDTKKILINFESDYDFIKVISWEDFQNYIKNKKP